MSEIIKEKIDNKTIIIETFEILTPSEKREVLTEIQKRMERDKDFDELFKMLKEIWELNKDIDDEELEKDIQEAVDYVRSKNV
ncbi:hypothetical protein ACFL27_05250 [candidate division CSSED10-310 bacterium]|uniref:Uncharacterized protein n=1 Tax=candidate division CSSED10-310 bacterium TaxID=2855610 RepID=A0ABV6YTQ8_UNCC1